MVKTNKKKAPSKRRAEVTSSTPPQTTPVRKAITEQADFKLHPAYKAIDKTEMSSLSVTVKQSLHELSKKITEKQTEFNLPEIPEAVSSIFEEYDKILEILKTRHEQGSPKALIARNPLIHFLTKTMKNISYINNLQLQAKEDNQVSTLIDKLTVIFIKMMKHLAGFNEDKPFSQIIELTEKAETKKEGENAELTPIIATCNSIFKTALLVIGDEETRQDIINAQRSILKFPISKRQFSKNDGTYFDTNKDDISYLFYLRALSLSDKSFIRLKEEINEFIPQLMRVFSGDNDGEDAFRTISFFYRSREQQIIDFLKIKLVDSLDWSPKHLAFSKQESPKPNPPSQSVPQDEPSVDELVALIEGSSNSKKAKPKPITAKESTIPAQASDPQEETVSDDGFQVPSRTEIADAISDESYARMFQRFDGIRSQKHSPSSTEPSSNIQTNLDYLNARTLFRRHLRVYRPQENERLYDISSYPNLSKELKTALKKSVFFTAVNMLGFSGIIISPTFIKSHSSKHLEKEGGKPLDKYLQDSFKVASEAKSINFSEDLTNGSFHLTINHPLLSGGQRVVVFSQISNPEQLGKRNLFFTTSYEKEHQDDSANQKVTPVINDGKLVEPISLNK